ncbi:MAG: hypothetical protein PHT84_05645 [Candidatus Pacebacteria bacterium]|nr:hypothetical protein [Candidatus Paceibacterota bacterium]
MAFDFQDDCLDILSRVALGVDFLNNNVDRDRDYLPYFFTDFQHDPAWSRHDWPDYGDLTGRYVEAFFKARRLLGIKSPGKVEIHEER